MIAAAEARSESKELLAHFRTVTRWILIIDLALLGLATFGSQLIMAVFGKGFSSGALPLTLLTIAVLINTVLGVSELFILIERPAFNLLNTVAGIAVSAGLGLFLVPRYGMTGAACATLAAYTVMNLLRLVMVRLFYRMHPFTRYHLRALFAAALSGAAAFLLKELVWALPPRVSDAVALAAFLVGYILLLHLFGTAAEDKALLQKFTSLVSPRRKESL